VGRVLGVEALGLYNRAYNLMQFPVATVVNVLDSVIFPALAKVQTEAKSLARALRLSASLVLLAYLPLSTVLVICAPDVIVVLLGARWLAMVAPFRILCLGLIFRAGYKTAGTVLKVRGRAFLFAGTQLAYAALVIAGAAIGSRHGIAGVAVGVLGALGAHYLLLNYLGFRAVGQSFGFLRRDLLAALLVSAVAGGAASAALTLATQAGFPAVARLASVGVAASGSCALLVWSGARTLVRPEVRAFVQMQGRRFAPTWTGLARRRGLSRVRLSQA
jgi:PST family polysaccharide transporter